MEAFLDKEDIDRLLRNVAGARRTASGVSIGDGEMALYITDVRVRDNDLTDEEVFFEPFCSKHEILRLRSISDPRDYLLRLRANAIVDSMRASRTFSKRRMDWEAKGRRWGLTRFYDAIDTFSGAYLKKLSKGHQSQLRPIPRGLAPLPNASAFAMRTVVGDLILVTEFLQHFFRYAHIALFGHRYGVEIEDRLAAAWIALRIMNGNETFDFDLDTRGTLPTKVEQALRTSVAAQMEFTFGHEFAHLLCGHLAEINGSGHEDSWVYSYACEFEADALAILNVRSKKAREQLRSAAREVKLFLQFLDAAVDAKLIGRSAISQTHPSPIDRLVSLDEHNLGVYDDAPNFLDAARRDIEFIIEATEERLKQSKFKDEFETYGSLYLPNYKTKILRDRIDY